MKAGSSKYKPTNTNCYPVMVIFSIGKSNTGQFTYECDVAKQMASLNLISAYDGAVSESAIIQRVEGYSAYYNTFCKP